MPRCFALLTASLVVIGLAVRAADPPVDKAPTDEELQKAKQKAAFEQERLRRNFGDFQRSLLALAQRYEKSSKSEDREKALVLRQAIDLAAKEGIDNQFNRLVVTLTASGITIQEINAAIGQNEQLAKTLREMISVLLTDNQTAKLKEEQKRLQDLLKELDKVLRQQKLERANTEAGRLDPKDLAKGQQKVTQDTKKLSKSMGNADSKDGKDKSPKGEAKPEGRDGKPEGEGKDDTKDAKGDAKAGDPQKGDAKDPKAGDPKGDAKDPKANDPKGDPKAGDPKGDPKAGDPQKGDAKDPKAGDPKGDPKAGDPKGDPKAGDPKAGDPKGDPKGKPEPGEAKAPPKDMPEPGESKGKPEGKEPKDAADNKAKPEGKGEAKPGDPQDPKGGEQPPKGEPKGDSKPQDGKPPKGQPKGDGQPQDGQPPDGGDQQQQPPQDQQQEEQTPGRKQVKDAIENQKKAEDNLKKKDKDKASGDQDEAIKDLEAVRKEIERRLKQLREEELERLLANLENRCSRMLTMQIEVYEGTKRIDATIQASADKKATRLEDNKSGDLATREEAIIAEANKTLQLLEEDGSAVAVPQVLENARDDMIKVQKRLFKTDVGSFTQGVEEDIINALKEVIEALKKAQQDLKDKKDQPPQPPPPGGQPQPQKLIDILAELRMLKSLQLQVNKRTTAYGKQYPGEQADEPDIVKELRNLANRQVKIQKATKDIATGKAGNSQ